MTEQTYKVGDVAYVDESQFGEPRVFEGKVIRVTPTGQIAVKAGYAECRFTKDGWEIGGGRYPRRLITKASFDAILLKMRERRERSHAGTQLQRAAILVGSRAPKADILAQIDAARALVEKLP